MVTRHGGFERRCCCDDRAAFLLAVSTFPTEWFQPFCDSRPGSERSEFEFVPVTGGGGAFGVRFAWSMVKVVAVDQYFMIMVCLCCGCS